MWNMFGAKNKVRIYSFVKSIKTIVNQYTAVRIKLTNVELIMFTEQMIIVLMG